MLTECCLSCKNHTPHRAFATRSASRLKPGAWPPDFPARRDPFDIVGLPMNQNSFGAASTLKVGGANYRIFRLATLEEKGIADISRLPFSHRILLENLLRNEDGRRVKASDIDSIPGGAGINAREISFMPARVLLQDFTGVPCVVDIAAMRDA